jgi:hypothetical protein
LNIFLSICISAWLFAGGGARASDECKVSDGVTTCSDDQSNGTENGKHNLDTNADNVIIDNLTADIGPSDLSNTNDLAGVLFTYEADDSLTSLVLQYKEDNFKIATNQAGTFGLAFESTAKAGSKGNHHDTSSGGNGDPGAVGRALNLTFGPGATIVSESNNTGGIGVFVETPGGAGGEGGGSDCCSGGHGGPGGGAGEVTINGDGTITMNANQSVGLHVLAEGGAGGNGNDSGVADHGGNGEAGGAGGDITLSSSGSWTIATLGVSDSTGVLVQALGGDGGHGGAGASSGGDGGGGSSGNFIRFNIDQQGDWTVSTVGSESPGISLFSLGGDASHGGQGDTDDGGHGGQGGQGAEILVGETTSNIDTGGDNSPALVLFSKAGQGGNGGNSETFGRGGEGGSGGGGGQINLKGDWTIGTMGSQSHGIAAYSLGADGGQGGDGTFSASGAGGSTGDSGLMLISIGGEINTAGGGAYGLIAQSVAGHAGSGGSTYGVVDFSASGGSAGAGGEIDLTNAAAITTLGDQSSALVAQSIGGGGGSGGTAFSAFYSTGGSGSLGGDGGDVSVNNGGALTASGNDAHGIFAQSIGGAGGSGGNAGGIVTLGGGGAAGSNAGIVMVTNDAAISTGTPGATPATGPDPVCGIGCSIGILAQSIGGGGGHGGTVGGAFSIGGGAGGGGHGAEVMVNTAADVTTTMIQSPGILAQSIGGGGGNGGGSGALNGALSVAVGGAGGNGGAGGEVMVSLIDSASITTAGDDSIAVHAQSIGGGGGHGGFALSAAGGVDIPAIAMAFGGSGGNGGNADDVTIDTFVVPGAPSNTVTTGGSRASGLVAQSIGGGGGAGGATVAVAGSDDTSVGVAFGGSGGSGGSGGAATIDSDSSVSTAGDYAGAIVAQSIGGGGGTGGLTVSGSVNLGGDGASVALGAGGGTGGGTSAVAVTSSGIVMTSGDQSPGILAQSIGGGGGNGGMTITGNLSTSGMDTAGVAIGSAAGSGGAGDTVAVQVVAGGDITTSGNRGTGVLAQSIGGGGGNGGITLNANLAASNDVQHTSVTLGSDGGSGGDASNVQISNAATINTGDASQFGYTQAHGVVAQSIGGGGGSGATTGFLQLSFDGSSQSHSVDLTMSGSGNGGSGGPIALDNSGAVATVNRNSHALFAQSVGGGGGDADAAMWSLVDLTTNSPAPSFSTDYVGGGSLGAGNKGGAVTVDNAAALSTAGPWSHGIFAQSVGGGGGSSAPLGNPFAPCNGCATESVIWNATVALGGQTGSGGDGDDVTVTGSNDIDTTGPGSYGVFAQSVGAGGGSSGAASALSQGGQFIGVNEFTALDAAMGALGDGSNPVSGNGGTVMVTHSAGGIRTEGIGATAIYAQSVGAGGGQGVIGSIGGGGNIDVGGAGDAAGDGGDVTVMVTGGSIEAGIGSGAVDIVSAAYGVFAQSVGGGGGHGGNVLMGASDNFASLAGLTSSNGNDSSGAGGAVTVAVAVDLATAGDSSVGILAQSVGGGGGIKGEAVTDPTGAKAGSNGGSGTAGPVAVSVSGNLATTGPNAHGVWAQTAGGNGSSTTTDTMIAVDVTGSVSATGAGTNGIYAQSVGDGRGPITIDVESAGMVQATAAAIQVKDAPTSTVSNDGTIASTEGASGTAILSENTTLTVDNNGTITGMICKDASCSPGATTGATSVVNFNNGPDGYLVSSGLLDIDMHVNDGTLDVGGNGIIGKVSHSGDLLQNLTSTLLIDLVSTPSGTEEDLLTLGGTAQFNAGALIEVSLLAGSSPQRNDTFNIIRARELFFDGVDLSTFLSLPVLDGMFWQADILTLVDGDYTEQTLRLRVVPEPSTLLLFGVAAMAVVKLGSRSYREGEIYYLNQQDMTISTGEPTFC